MAIYVCNGANMQCSFGTSPATLTQLAAHEVVFITYRGNYISRNSFMGDYGFFSHHRICLLKL